MGSLERAVDRDRGCLEHLGGLLGREPQHVTEDQDGALPGRQVLERSGERELDALPLLVACVRAEQCGVDSELRVGVRLEPDRLGKRLAESSVRVGGGPVVDRQHTLGPLLDHAQTRVGGDPIEPGAKRTSTLEAGESAPGTEQCLLQRVLGVGHGAEHPVAVRAKLGLIGPDKAGERLLVARPCGFEQPALVAHRFGSQSATSPASGLETMLRQPDGPCRGSSSTTAPSARARSVDASIRSTST